MLCFVVAANAQAIYQHKLKASGKGRFLR